MRVNFEAWVGKLTIEELLLSQFSFIFPVVRKDLGTICKTHRYHSFFLVIWSAEVLE